MIMGMTRGDPMRTMSTTRPSARPDDRGGFLPRRVACVAGDIVGSALPKGLGERLAQLLVLCFQPLDALGGGLQSPQQRGV
jgi:hypothetical protein